MRRSKYSILDNNSGEIVGAYEPKKPRRPGHKYMLIYYENLLQAGLKISLLETAILGEMDTLNRLELTTSAKKHFMAELGISLQAINNMLNRMQSKDLLCRVSFGRYMVNPLFYSKSNRNKTLELVETYNKARSQTINKRKPRKKRIPKIETKRELKIVNFISDDEYPL